MTREYKNRHAYVKHTCESTQSLLSSDSERNRTRKNSKQVTINTLQVFEKKLRHLL